MQREAVNIVQKILHAAGVHLSRYPLHSEYESVLHDFLAGFDIGCVLDVGANVGNYGSMLRRIGYSGRIVSFEPALATYDRLEQRAAGYKHWETHRTALGSTDGTVPMRVFPGHENSTLADVGKFARDWFPSAFKSERIEEVPMHRLDSWIARASMDQSIPTILKIDTEGHDWAVIEGAGVRINEFVGLQTELMVQPVWEGTPLFGESVTRLATMGFEPVAFSVPNRARLSAIVVDGLFRNTRFAPEPNRATRMWNPEGMGLRPQVWDDSDHPPNTLRDSSGASWKS